MAPFHNANHLDESRRCVTICIVSDKCVDGNYWAVHTGRGFLFSSLGTWGHVKASRSHRPDAKQHERRGCFFSSCICLVTTATATVNCESANALPLPTTRDTCGPYADLWPPPFKSLIWHGRENKRTRVFARLNGGVEKGRGGFTAEWLLDRRAVPQGHLASFWSAANRRRAQRHACFHKHYIENTIGRKLDIFSVIVPSDPECHVYLLVDSAPMILLWQHPLLCCMMVSNLFARVCYMTPMWNENRMNNDLNWTSFPSRVNN